MSNPIKIGIVGLGRAGRKMHIGELTSTTQFNIKEKFEIAAVCDVIPERVEEIVNKFGCKGYSNIDDLINDPDVELVDIATRSCDHFEHAMKALAKGKSVVLEKPATVSYEQAVELFKHANKEGMPRLFARQNRRFEKMYSAARGIIDSGILGNVTEISVMFRDYQRRDDWQTIKEFGGGQALNWGPHLVDHALMLLDSDVKYQYGNARHATAGGDSEDHFAINLIGENNRRVDVMISGASAINRGRWISIYGNRGAAHIENNVVKLRYIDPNADLDPVVSNPGTPGAAFGTTGTYSSKIQLPWIEAEYKLEGEDLNEIWAHVYESFRNGKEYPIKDEQVLNLMKTIFRLFDEHEIVDSTAYRDSVKEIYKKN